MVIFDYGINLKGVRHMEAIYIIVISTIVGVVGGLAYCFAIIRGDDWWA
jgi:hypothetical protein